MNVAEAVPGGEGWSARLQLGFRMAGRRTVLAERQHQGPLTVQRPFYPEGGVCHVYLLHPPGGVVGGDRLQIDAELATACHGLVTTPGATKFYRSAGAMACQTQSLRIADGASLEWLPQENIFFPGARVNMHTRVDLHGSARLALWETHCLGRPVIGEGFDDGLLDSRLELWRDGEPLLIERLRVDAASRQRLSILGGHAVVGTAILDGAEEAHLHTARALIEKAGLAEAGATLVEDLLVLRYLGDSTECARNLFIDTWSALREPLLQRPATAPRIWST